MRRTALQFTVVILGSVLTARAPSPVCTPVPVPIGRLSADVFFIGAALPDTILAGPGHETWSTGSGHSGFGRTRTIYGQLVEIEQLRGVSRARLPAETKRVVLVPWDYGPDCSTVVWGQSARWVPPGDRVVFKATLRPRDEWANALPTLDVHTPEFSLYPFDTNRLYMLRDTAINDLSLEAVLDLYERLPLDSVLFAAPDSAMQPLEAWARSNPALATRQPARTILEFVRVEAEERRVSMIKSPIAGTYRFVVTVPHVDSLIVYARTDERPWSTERGRYAVGTPEDSASDNAAIGYTLLTAWASSTRALPRRADHDNSSPTISISLTPVLQTADSSVWHGSDGALDSDRNRAFWNRAVRPLEPLIEQTRPKDWYYMPGFWTIYPDGTVRYRYIVERDGIAILSIRGERISFDVMTRPKREN